LLIALATGCLSSDLPAGSFGTASDDPSIHFARAGTGLVNYGGTGYYQWKVILSTGDGCGGDTVGTFEINTSLTGANAFPTGDIPIRADQVPATVPSALATFTASTGVSGTLTIKAVSGSGPGTRIDGSANATMTTGPMTASFIAYDCP
jgi:hypothetical protein